MTQPMRPSRRAAITTGLAAATALTLPARLGAQPSGPVKLGSLVPMTGGGGPFGPNIRAAQEAVVKEVNAAGGVLGRPIELIGEDDQTNPEAAVRAARKLIDIDKVIAIMGPWASAVGSAVAPLCWENKVMLILISAADSITQLPHQGYIARTQPSTKMQSEQFAKFAIAEGAKHFYLMMPQTPFTESTFKAIGDMCAPKGIKISTVVYDAKKNGYRSEVDAMMQATPDTLMLGGYLPDSIVLAKDVYRAGFDGRKVAYAFGVNAQFVEAVGPDVAEGIHTIEPIADAGSSAYARLQKLLGRQELDIYAAQGYDEANLAILAIANAKEASGTAIRDNIRKIGDPGGDKVDNALDGLKALAAGKTINYLGASSSCKFEPNGDISFSHFRVNVVRKGKIETYRVT